MRKKVLIGLSAVFAAVFGLSCTDDETGPWKDYDLSVTSNIASGNGNVPYEGATVVFTDGRMLRTTAPGGLASPLSMATRWLSSFRKTPSARSVPDRSNSSRSPIPRWSKPLHSYRMPRRKPPSPRRPKPTCWTWFFTLTVRPKTFRR